MQNNGCINIQSIDKIILDQVSLNTNLLQELPNINCPVFTYFFPVYHCLFVFSCMEWVDQRGVIPYCEALGNYRNRTYNADSK